MKSQTEWEKEAAEVIEAEKRKSTVTFYSIMAWVLPLTGLFFSFFMSIAILFIGIGFGVIISALGKILRAIYDKQSDI